MLKHDECHLELLSWNDYGDETNNKQAGELFYLNVICTSFHPRL